MNYLELISHVLPEIAVLVTALVLIGMGCAGGSRGGGKAVLAVTAAGLGLALAAVVFGPESGRLLEGMIVVDALTRLFKAVLLALTLGTALFLFPGGEAGGNEGRGAENSALLLLALLGLLVVVGTENLLLLFVGLELASLALYLMVVFAAPAGRPAEAALRYFFFGSVAAAFLLFGFSFIYGATGSIDLRVIAKVLAAHPVEPILPLGVGLALVGFGFKVAAVPFHLWAPDVYQSAPAPAAGFIASASKVAGFFIVAKVLVLGFGVVEGSADWGAFAMGWAPLVAVLAALSMVVGNLAALAQQSVRRLLAYSGIGHSGFILTALVAANAEAVRAVLFYSVIYGVASLAAFGVAGCVLRARGADRLEDFAGLGRTAPAAAGVLALALLSLAGLPPLVGFFGKFQLFAAALSGGTPGTVPGLLWLVALALLMSAVSLYYYLRVLKQVFFAPAPADAAPTRDTSAGTAVCLVCGSVLVLLGLFPSLVLQPLQRALVQLF